MLRLRLFMQGKSDSEIAEIFSQDSTPVSLRTINNHVRSILTKLKAVNRTGACLAALTRLKSNTGQGWRSGSEAKRSPLMNNNTPI